MSGHRSFMEMREQIKDRRNCMNTRSSTHYESDCDDLVIDDDYDQNVVAKKRQLGVRLAIEPISLVCNWKHCFIIFGDYEVYIRHVTDHALEVDEDNQGTYSCGFRDCNHFAKSLMYLVKHVAFHSYHERLKNIGENVAERSKLPNCTQSACYVIPAIEYDYGCEWEDCDAIIGTIHEYLIHIKIHVNRCPKYCKKNEFAKCGWKGCRAKFTSQYKLCDHVRSHSKEKTIACSTCGTMFASKTKFTDHRKRQIPMEQHSFQCSECSKLFPTERLLRDHVRSHINHYKCNMCDMTCQKPAILARHIRLRHLNEKPIKCSLCEQCCVSKYNLEQHLATHCAEKLMSCDECDFKCRSEYGLQRHCQLVHEQGWTQVYECHCCSKCFHRGGLLTKHLIKQHDFNWPSGHSRFRYKEVTDGVFRLQTVRFESLEVTQEMLAFRPPIDKNIKYTIKKDPNSAGDIPAFVLTVSDSDEATIVQPANNEIIITIDDVDEKGNVIKTKVINSREIFNKNDEDSSSVDDL